MSVRVRVRESERERERERVRTRGRERVWEAGGIGEGFGLCERVGVYLQRGLLQA